MQFDLRISADALAALRTAGQTAVDAAAEKARLVWITDGSGQAMEYIQSQTESDAAMLAPDPLDPTQYPLMVAELNANVACGNTTITLRQIVLGANAQVVAWRAAGATIKQTRLTAKMQIANATTGAAIDAIVAALTWPTPPAS